MSTKLYVVHGSGVQYRDFLYRDIKPIYITIRYISRYTYTSSTLACDLQCNKLSNKICYETITFITCNVLIIQLIRQLNT